MKRLQTPQSGRPRKTTAREDRLLAWKSKASPFSTAAELHETRSPEVPMSTRTVCRILSRNGLHGRMSAQKTSTEQKTIKKLCGFCQGPQPAKRMDAGKVAEGGFLRSSVELHHSRRKYCRRPSGAHMDPRFTQKTVKFGGGKIMVWGYIQFGGVREICRVEGNINSLKYQEVLAASNIPNHKRDQILQQDGAPSHKFHFYIKVPQGEEDQGAPGLASPVTRHEHHWAGLG